MSNPVNEDDDRVRHARMVLAGDYPGAITAEDARSVFKALDAAEAENKTWAMLMGTVRPIYASKITTPGPVAMMPIDVYEKTVARLDKRKRPDDPNSP